MAKKNFSMTLSVFIAAFVVTILSYILLNQNFEQYTALKMAMPEDIFINKLLPKEAIQQLKSVENIANIGLKDEPQAIRIKEELLAFSQYNSDYFKMQHHFLKRGRLPQQAHEIVVSDKTFTSLGLKLESEVDVELGNRLFKGEQIEPSKHFILGENFEVKEQRSYKIVGVSYSNPQKTQEAFGLLESPEGLYYPCIRLKDFAKAYATKSELIDLFENMNYGKATIILNEELLHFLSISENGRNIFQFMLFKLVTPISLMLIFIFMIKNIFNVWAIYKMKEYAMYKSIGATHSQIYWLLLKDSLKISVLPLVLGEGCGLITMTFIFSKIFSMQQALFLSIPKSFQLNGLIILIITAILLLIIGVAVSFPARYISKIEILEGLKENVHSRSYKKKRANNLFKELRINNRKVLKPQFVIMTVGLIMVESLIGIGTINSYNEIYSGDKSEFNLSLRYSTKDNQYPAIFDRLLEHIKPQQHMLTIQKRLYVDTSQLALSESFRQIGYQKGFANIFYYPEQQMVDGVITGVPNEVFKKISENPQDLVLANQVQKNPKSFYGEAEFIPYVDKNLQELKIKYLEDFEWQRLKVNKQIDHWPIQTKMDLYTIQMVTSMENFQAMMKNAEAIFNKNGMELPIIYYTLEMQVAENELPAITKYIRSEMENHIQANEKFKMTDAIKESKSKAINDQGMMFLFMVVLSAAICLNIANAYSSTNLYFFNRQKEMGILLSNGMCRADMERMLIKEMLGQMLSSVALSIGISATILGALISTIPYIDLQKYIEMLPRMPLIGLILLISLSSYIIYHRAMKKVMDKELITLIKYN